MMQKALLSLALAFTLKFACAQSVSYVANSGVLIEYSATKILIDAIFDQYNLKLDAPSEETLKNMIGGAAPYNGVDLVLVTHALRDHFNAEYVADFMTKNPKIKLIAPPQASDSLKKFPESYSKLNPRVISYPWKRSWKQYVQDNITVRSIYSRHSAGKNSKTQNQMFLISIGDKKILHVGDTQMEPENFEDLRLIYEDIDVAIVPFWYMSSVYGAELIKDYINPKKVVAVHLPKQGAETYLAKIKNQFPNGVIFKDMGQKVNF